MAVFDLNGQAIHGNQIAAAFSQKKNPHLQDRWGF
jgi:hypothetical protein